MVRFAREGCGVSCVWYAFGAAAAAASAGRDGADLGAHLPAFRALVACAVRRTRSRLPAALARATGAGRAVPEAQQPRSPMISALKSQPIVANGIARTAEICQPYRGVQSLLTCFGGLWYSVMAAFALLWQSGCNCPFCL